MILSSNKASIVSGGGIMEVACLYCWGDCCCWDVMGYGIGGVGLVVVMVVVLDVGVCMEGEW